MRQRTFPRRPDRLGIFPDDAGLIVGFAGFPLAAAAGQFFLAELMAENRIVRKSAAQIPDL